MSMPLDRPIICPVLIGRDGQLNALLRLFAAATGGRGHTALLAGEAGVGKTRLVAALKERLTAGPARTGQQAVRVLAGRCFEPDHALPFAPLVDLLRAYCAACPPGEITALLRVAGAPLLRLLPELAPYLPGGVVAGQAEPEADKRRLFHALMQVFARLAAASPTLIILEDLHWSDDTSLEFLAHLARRAPTERLLLLLTYRDAEVQPDLATFLAALDRDRLASDFALARLSVAETDAMLRAIFGLGHPARADFLDALYTLTEGNPFFIEE